jgi:signal transduction histidine kinase
MPARLRRISRRLRRSALLNYAAASAVVCALLLLTAFVAVGSYRDAQAATRTQVSNLSRVLAEQTYGLFKSVDLTLRNIEADRPETIPRFDPEFQASLRAQAYDLAFVRAFYVIDAKGTLVQDSDQPRAIKLGDWNYFQAFTSDPYLELFVGAPFLSHTEHVWSIPVMRRLTGSDGAFAGVVGASVEPRYLNSFYNDLTLGRGAAIALFDTRDGDLLAARNPATNQVDFTPRRFPAFAGLQQASGVFTARDVDGRKRIIAYRKIPEFSLGVAVGASVESVHARWRRTAWPLFLAAASLSALVFGLTFVTNRREQERAEAEERTLRAQKLETIGQMTGGVAHDFNNVLAAAAAGLQMIRRKGASPPVLEGMEQAISRGQNLVKQLLAFARRQDLETARHDISSLVAAMDQVLTHAAGLGNRLHLRLKHGLPLCWTDQTQFDAALVNLVVNARHAMPDGGDIFITTAAERLPRDNVAGLPAGLYVVLYVEDTGTGMDEATLNRIFEPFFTTKGEGGTGLGLAQIYGFMRQTGGGVTVESEPGIGTTFRLLFRAVEDDLGAGPAATV